MDGDESGDDWVGNSGDGLEERKEGREETDRKEVDPSEGEEEAEEEEAEEYSDDKEAARDGDNRLLIFNILMSL